MHPFIVLPKKKMVPNIIEILDLSRSMKIMFFYNIHLDLSLCDEFFYMISCKCVLEIHPHTLCKFKNIHGMKYKC